MAIAIDWVGLGGLRECTNFCRIEENCYLHENACSLGVSDVLAASANSPAVGSSSHMSSSSRPRYTLMFSHD